MKKQVKKSSNNVIKEKEQVIQRRDNTRGITLVALVVRNKCRRSKYRLFR